MYEIVKSNSMLNHAIALSNRLYDGLNHQIKNFEGVNKNDHSRYTI